MSRQLLNLLACDNGATAIEYALIVASIAVAISVVVFTIGTDLTNLLSGLSSTLATAAPAT